MAGITYTKEAADRLERIYRGADVEAQRADTLAKLALKTGEHVLDVGSGPGFLADSIGSAVGSSGHVTGVDISADLVARATSRNQKPWVDYLVGDATDLPLETDSFDVVVSTQVAEYVPDIAGFCSEFSRVLRPGGRGLILATDWDAVVWHSSDPDRMSRVMEAFKPHCAHPNLPRSLSPQLRSAGLMLEHVSYHPIINTQWYDGCYSQTAIPLVSNYVTAQGGLSETELADWAGDLEQMNARGAYFFASGRFCFHIAKPA